MAFIATIGMLLCKWENFHSGKYVSIGKITDYL